MIDTTSPMKKLLTISHEVVECPTAKDYEIACKDFCATARNSLSPYIYRVGLKSGGRETVNYQAEVMEIMGCLSFV